MQTKTTKSRSGIFYLHLKMTFSSIEIKIIEFGTSGIICKVLHNCNAFLIAHVLYMINIQLN